MKQHMVVLIQSGGELYDHQYRRRGLGEAGDGVLYLYPTQTADEWNGAFSGKKELYFTNSVDEAQFLAKYLCGKYPGNRYVVASAAFLYQSTPGPVVGAQFSEKGVLPL
jgi:hypothetical protein